MIRMTRSDRPYRGVGAAERWRRVSLSPAWTCWVDQHGIAELTIRTILPAGRPTVGATSTASPTGRIRRRVRLGGGRAGRHHSITGHGSTGAEQTRAGMASIVRTICRRPRRRLLFTRLANAVITLACGIQRPVRHAVRPTCRRHLHAPANDHVKAVARFAVGGVRRAISAWLAGDDSFPTSWSIRLSCAAR